MNEQDLRVIKTKKNLQLALIQLLKEKDLEKIKVTELCRLSGITRRTFYLHYENVRKYFEEFIEQLLEELEQSMEKTTKYRMMTNQQLVPNMIHLFEHVYLNKESYQFIFSGNSNFAYYQMFFKRIKVIVKSSMELMDLDHELTDFQVAYQANAILGMILEWYFENFQKSVEEMNRLLMTSLRI
ncbi:TetR family transcriptional regulator [Salipaludibacillus neizhouensis]|uniref:TetR family transcriptional regulator n=1 Tax=Salipaludibacillus neizhouensis TaxID=885475 RepID=A0A3A9K5B9_9BACI|nr:TetR/AcrR family transcriptional regulator C-terminal domain-containing protein [Salipaludibacillus neizhouensis]RKL65551.1 TetR family transcriptional regulator [Salipaludibacillus neizhouensis]